LLGWKRIQATVDRIELQPRDLIGRDFPSSARADVGILEFAAAMRSLQAVEEYVLHHSPQPCTEIRPWPEQLEFEHRAQHCLLYQIVGIRRILRQ
jgi:hypothetical protein